MAKNNRSKPQDAQPDADAPEAVEVETPAAEPTPPPEAPKPDPQPEPAKPADKPKPKGPTAADLIEHLQSTGTGAGKLQRLRRYRTADEVLAALEACGMTVTADKARKWLDGQGK